MSWMYNCKFKRQALKLYKMIKNNGENCTYVYREIKNLNENKHLS